MLTKTFFASALLASCTVVQAIELSDSTSTSTSISSNQYDGEDFRNYDLEGIDFTRSRENKAQAPEVISWFKGATYQAKSKEDKMTDLWRMIIRDDTVADLSFASFSEVLSMSSNGSFCQNSDEIKAKRNKVNHRQGVVGQIEWISTGDHPYTGIFESGSETAIIRLSETQLLTETSTGLLPSLAIKFLADGKKSANIVAMPSFDASTSWDFFHAPMSNRVTPFSDTQTIQQETIQKKLIEGTSFPFDMGISDVALWNQDGTEIGWDVAVSPYKLEFRSDIHFPDEKDENEMFYDQLMSIDEGTILLEAWAYDGPESEGHVASKIADIKLTSELMTSLFGDERLHFQHQRINRDRRLYTDRSWKSLDTMFSQDDNVADFDLSAWPVDDEEAAKAMFDSQIESYGCPFAWLLNMM